MRHQVVVRYKDGRVAKGTTADFAPNRTSFTLEPTPPGADRSATVLVEDLKAVFFVRSFEGNREYREHKIRIPEGTIGRRYLLTFTDGETMRGTALRTGGGTRRAPRGSPWQERMPACPRTTGPTISVSRAWSACRS